MQTLGYGAYDVFSSNLQRCYARLLPDITTQHICKLCTYLVASTLCTIPMAMQLGSNALASQYRYIGCTPDAGLCYLRNSMDVAHGMHVTSTLCTCNWYPHPAVAECCGQALTDPLHPNLCQTVLYQVTFPRDLLGNLERPK